MVNKSAEKIFSKIKKVFNDRSLRLLSSSSGFAHNPNKFENPTMTPAKKYQPNTEFRNLYEFFNWKRWNLICISDLAYKLDMLESDNLEWHTKKGFKTKLNKDEAHLILTSLREKTGKEPIMNSHTFQFNPKINKYDVSKMNLEAPEGTSIFQTVFENEMAEENFAKLMNKHQSNVHRLKQLPSCPSEIEEQRPIAGQVKWYIWNITYYNYYDHIKSNHHRKWARKFENDYLQIDKCFAELNQEFETEYKYRRKPIVRKQGKESVTRTPKKTGVTKRAIKEKNKIEQQLIEYIHDRLVVMQIETQSQPNNRSIQHNQNMINQLSLKNLEEIKKLCSPNSNSMELLQSWVRPYPYIKNRIRRHVAKRPKKLFEYDDAINKPAGKRSRRNKRLRQTYFATSFNNNKSFDLEDAANKRKKLIDTTLDMYFPIQENVDQEMIEQE